MVNILFLFGGITLILFSANWLVDGASAIAKKFGISDMVVGLTIVAFGTSAPELTVNIFSAFKGATDIAIGNILGSNISNILLILGVSAIIFPISIQLNTKWKEIPFCLLAVVILGIMANGIFIDSSPDGNLITRADGLILLCFMIIFLVYTFGIARHTGNPISLDIDPKIISTNKASMLVLLGLIGLFFGGKYLVTGAVEFAKIMGMSEKVIGLTIIAIGTSIPELATSVVAAFKQKSDIAIGNIIGSNIFNVFFILGTTAIIQPIHINTSINFDIGIAFLASVLLFISTLTFKKKSIDRVEGLIFVTLYVCYITYSILN
ncbi:MAG TPA: sodium:proton exchanger [Bacteroidales bacterium]|nr:sodium:proton exchanger [Bacteroidales bacterium]